jgi:hypothetical protein
VRFTAVCRSLPFAVHCRSLPFAVHCRSLPFAVHCRSLPFAVHCRSLQRKCYNFSLVLVAINRIRVILETDIIAILINHLTSIVKSRILIYNNRTRLQHIHQKHSNKEPQNKWKKLNAIKELHPPN